MKDHHVTAHKGYFGKSDCSAEAFLDLLEDRLSVSELDFAGSVEKNIPIYSASEIEPTLSSDQRQALMAEWAYVFSQRSGIVVIKGALSDMETIDQITDLFNTIIEEERLESSGGDHFGERGANDRIWNSLQKLCLRDPKLFARYFASPAIAAVSEAWLGPWSQMTTQVNLVRPGGKPQVCHRDYHLGFMTLEQAERFPAHAHLFSGGLTLQGAIAHCDVPIESGPTKLLPNSQRFAAGYIAAQLPEFREIFEERFVQLPLEKGDALFFNPALFHAAGENRSSDIHRMVNLLQVSSPMGRSLEQIDRPSMLKALYPALAELSLPQKQLDAVVAASAEAYPFPTNLDTDPPIGGLASESQAELVKRALSEGMTHETFNAALDQNFSKRLP